MRLSHIFGAVLVAISLGMSAVRAVEPANSAGRVAPLLPKQKIVMLGDSITHGGYQTMFLQLVFALRRQNQTLFHNAGCGGNRISGALRRLDYDVLAKRPDRVFVMFGMNDIDRKSWGNANEKSPAILKRRKEALTAYRNNLTELVRRLQLSGCLVALQTPTPYDQYGSRTLPALAAVNEPGLVECAKIVREIAIRYDTGIVELQKPLTALLKTHPELALCGSDRVHPQQPGHFIITSLILSASGGLPPVAEISVDAAGKAEAVNAKLGELKCASDKITFNYHPEALPFPVTKEYLIADEVFPLAGFGNQETLRVTGLVAGRYALKIDGCEVAKFTSDELAAGINLARLDTPSTRLAKLCYDKALEMRSAENRLRDLIRLDEKLKAQKVDIENAAAVESAVNRNITELLKKNGKEDFFTRSYRAYLQNRPRRLEFEHTYQRVANELFDMAQPAQALVEITRIQ